MMRKKLGRSILILVVSLLSVGLLASVISGSEPQYGGTFKMAYARNVGTLDPHSAHSVDRINVGIMLYDQLTTFDTEGNVVPNLAESWDLSDDAKTYTFYLHQGVKFHSGREFTAADVKYSFERLSNPKTKALGFALLDPIKGKKEFANGDADEIVGIRIIDDYTVEIELNAPDVAFLHKLGMAYASIVGHEGINEDLEMEEPVGTGPFVLGEHVPNLHLKLDRNPDFWQDGKPYLDHVIVYMNVDESVQLMRYQTGDLHYLGMTPVLKHTLEANPRYKDHIVFGPGPALQGLTMNINYEPFNKKEVRQAINWAVNRERIVNDVLAGLGIPARTPVTSSMAEQLGLGEWYGYDPDKAKALLAEAGYPDGFKAELVVVANEIQKLASEAVQQDLAAIGIQIEVKVLEAALYTATMNQGTVPFGNMNIGSQMGHPDEIFYTFLHSANSPGLNRAAYQNAELDALIEEARSTIDEEERNQVYADIVAFVMEEAPWAPLYYNVSAVAVPPELEGLELLPTRPSIRVTNTWFNK